MIPLVVDIIRWILHCKVNLRIQFCFMKKRWLVNHVDSILQHLGIRLNESIIDAVLKFYLASAWKDSWIAYIITQQWNSITLCILIYSLTSSKEEQKIRTLTKVQSILAFTRIPHVQMKEKSKKKGVNDKKTGRLFFLFPPPANFFM